MQVLGKLQEDWTWRRQGTKIQEIILVVSEVVITGGAKWIETSTTRTRVFKFASVPTKLPLGVSWQVWE